MDIGRPGRAGLVAGLAVPLAALAACGGSSPGASSAGTAQPLTGTTRVAGDASPLPAAAMSAPCQHPDDSVRSALAGRLADGVEVQRAALLETRSSVHGSRVFYLAGQVYRDGSRVGTAVWASAAPGDPSSWAAVDAMASSASAVTSAAGTPAQLSDNVASYSRVSSCATLGF